MVNMKLRLFPRAALNFLREDGSVVDGDGRACAPARLRTLALSRALCRFHAFRAPAGLSFRQLAHAARLEAEAHAPFLATGSLILRSPEGAAIWFWDKDQVADLLRGQLTGVEIGITPESVHATPGEGWRMVETLEGFEAQYWRESALLASTWRRRAFTTDQWTAFVLGADCATSPAPKSAPAAMKAPYQPHQDWRRWRIDSPLGWSDAERAGTGVAFCAAGVAVFLAGQALRFEHLARTDAAASSRIAAAASADAEALQAMTRLGLIQAYQNEMAAPDVLAAAAQAFEVLSRFDLEAADWSIDQTSFHVRLDYPAADVPVRDVLTALEAAPMLRNAEPEFGARDAGVAIATELDLPTLATAAAPASGWRWSGP